MSAVSAEISVSISRAQNDGGELSKTSHTVRMNEGDEVSASLKMNESDPSYDDSCIDESWPYDKDSLVQKGDWTGDHDTGVFCVTFIPL
ncbi:unnamed protein product [Agarophyton chilense]